MAVTFHGTLWQMEYKLKNSIAGALIYTTGDAIAALLSGECHSYRLLGMLLIGSTVYAFEIPNCFNWITKVTRQYSGLKLSLYKTGLAMLYFNPLWIARHLFFIKLLSFKTEEINVDLFRIALWSFVVNIPISLIANYAIQNKMPLHLRFFASAVFSGLMAVYYALSAVWF